MKKISIFVFLLLVCTTAAFYSTSHPRTVSQQDNTATYAAWFHDMTVFPITETARASKSPPITQTPRPSLVPTSTKTPAPTATMDYPRLVAIYLTPFTPYPTRTRDPNQPTQSTPTPTATAIDPLKLVIAKKLPANWIPTPPRLVKPNDSVFGDGLFREYIPAWITGHIQAATDLMNFTHADQKSFVKYVDTWGPDVQSSRWRTTWLLKNDLDHDGQPEWLASIPIYTEDPELCCAQMMIVFEKKGDVYQPVYYKKSDGSAFHGNWQTLQVSDLNRNGYLDVVTSTTTCGVACSTTLNIGEWNGQKWQDYNGFYIGGNGTNQVLFMDVDGNGTTEIIVQYKTIYYMDQGYPARNAVDIYSWKNGQYTLLEAWLQPNKTPYAVLRDVYAALQSKDADEALRLAQPAMANLAESCSTMDTYTAIQVMLAQALRNDPKAMEATLSFIIASCNSPKNPAKTPVPNQLKNGFIPAANILWLAYQKTHSPLLACQAMQRFITNQRRTDNYSDKPEFSFEAGMLNYNFVACPLK